MKHSFYFSVFFLLCHLEAMSQPLVAQLHVPMIKQFRSNWCWAACADMVDEFHYLSTTPPTRDQCDIVNIYINRTNDYIIQTTIGNPSLRPLIPHFCNSCICKSGTTPSGNFRIPYNLSPAFFIGATYHTVFLEMGYYSSIEKGISFDDVKKEILDCRPIVLGIQYGSSSQSGGDHIVVATGYEHQPSGVRSLFINDPADKDSCQTCEINRINIDALSSSSCVANINFYLTGIRRKGIKSCDSCSYMNNEFYTFQETTSFTKNLAKSTEVEYFNEIVKRLEPASNIKIPINHIIINAKKRYNLFDNLFDAKNLIQRDTDYFYYAEQKDNVLTRQPIKGVSTVTQIKSCGYPTQFVISTGFLGNKKINIDLTKEKNSTLEIYRTHGPIYKDYYFFKDGNKTYRISPEDIIRSKTGKVINEPLSPISKGRLNRVLRNDLRLSSVSLTKP